jgi:hypothetical protein
MRDRMVGESSAPAGRGPCRGPRRFRDVRIFYDYEIDSPGRFNQTIYISLLLMEAQNKRTITGGPCADFSTPTVDLAQCFAARVPSTLLYNLPPGSEVNSLGSYVVLFSIYHKYWQ